MKNPYEVVDLAEEFARAHHTEQYCAHHLEIVAFLVAVVQEPYPDEEFDHNLVAAAWLHDVVEDTDVTEEQLRAEFGDDIGDLVMACTHEGADDTVGHWFPRLLPTLENRRAVTLKFADRLSNISRPYTEGWDDDKLAWYLQKSRFWRVKAGEKGWKKFVECGGDGCKGCPGCWNPTSDNPEKSLWKKI